MPLNCREGCINQQGGGSWIEVNRFEYLQDILLGVKEGSQKTKVVVVVVILSMQMLLNYNAYG